MNTDMMLSFLSEETLFCHQRYAEGLLTRAEALSTGKGKPTEEELLLTRESRLHSAYFSSFGAGGQNRLAADFLYVSKCRMLEKRWGFYLFYRDGRGRICGGFEDEYRRLPERFLAVDLYEHAYFPDYGFNRERYVAECLYRLDFSKILENAGKEG